MAYQAKRKKIFKEEFQLVDENGNVEKTIFVELDPSVVAEKLSKKYLALQNALEAIKEAEEKKEHQYSTLAMAMKDVLEAVFGENDTKTIVKFYEERYLEMAREVLPFIKDVVVPQVRKMAQEERKNIAAGYNRKQRRLFGKKRG